MLRDMQSTVGLTFREFATRAIASREAGGLRCAQGYRSILDTHLLPRLGDVDLGAFGRADYRAFLADLRHAPSRRGGRLSSRSLRNIAALCRSIFEDAVEDEIIAANPCRRGRRDLPRIADADPSWRPGAVYGREEVVALISDERISALSRVAFALHGLTGPRSGMLAALMWSAYDPDDEPLGKIVYAWSYSTADRVIRPAKTNMAQVVPVHPVLAKILAGWYLAGWRETFERSPGPSDLVIPANARNGKTQPMRSDGLYQRLNRACARIGIRFRGPHCLRATFISLAQEDGASGEMIRSITHPSPGDVFRGYSRFSWPALCDAVGRLKIDLGAIK